VPLVLVTIRIPPVVGAVEVQATTKLTAAVVLGVTVTL
jgi:hypothetical protein